MSLGNNSAGTRSAAMTRNGGVISARARAQSSADPSTFYGDVNQPNLNILNQARTISQLSANNTSFDPNSNEAQMLPQQHQADGMITAFSALAVQSIDGDNGSAKAVRRPSSTRTINLSVSPPLQRQHMMHMQVHQQQLFQTNQQTGQSNNTPPHPHPASVMVQQGMPVVTHQSQMPHQSTSHHHVQQPLQPKPMQNGRVPATKHDNRKLFVGGLPNEVTDYTFLQFFQQYGEVVDSIVLLDRRTKRSRGFGFVTFADESVSDAFLNIIPGRTGTVNMFGKNCEIKASEPKTEEFYHQQPHLHPHHQNQQHQSHYTPHRMVFGANGPAIHPITNQSGGPSPHLNYPGQEQGAGVPLYSHSTITRTTAGPILSADGSPQEGTSNVYIQNNFYTLPPGTQLSPSHPLNASPTMETLQMREEKLMNGGATVTYTHQPTSNAGHAPFAYSGEVLQPAYPGPEVENSGGSNSM